MKKLGEHNRPELFHMIKVLVSLLRNSNLIREIQILTVHITPLTTEITIVPSHMKMLIRPFETTIGIQVQVIIKEDKDINLALKNGQKARPIVINIVLNSEANLINQRTLIQKNKDLEYKE